MSSALASQPHGPAAPPHWQRLDHLRAVAALLVFFFHVLHTQVGDLRSGNALVSIIDEGHTGIALFMVLSGFLFTRLAGDAPLQYWGFLRNRVLRIYPLFVVAVMLQLFIATYNDHRNYGGLQLLTWLLPFRSETIPLSPQFAQLWTIWVELQFYLIFPFLLALVRQTGLRALLGLLVLLVCLRALVYADLGSVRFIAYETIFGRLDQFVVGMILGTLWLRSPTWAAPARWAWVWLVLAVLGLLLVVHGFSLQVGYTNLASAGWIVWPPLEAAAWALVVHAYLRLPQQRWLGVPARALAWVGIVSYSVYVWHMLVVLAVLERVPLLPIGPAPAWQALATGLLVALPITLALAALSHGLIERPFLRRKRSYLGPHV